MSSNLIHDRGRGPELVGTRTTVYNLLPYLLDDSMTEVEIGRLNGVTPEQVAAARGYILTHPDTVLSEHLRIEERIAVGNPPEVIEQARQAHETFMQFKKWFDEEKKSREAEAANNRSSSGFPSFREWLAAHESPTSGA